MLEHCTGNCFDWQIVPPTMQASCIWGGATAENWSWLQSKLHELWSHGSCSRHVGASQTKCIPIMQHFEKRTARTHQHSSTKANAYCMPLILLGKWIYKETSIFIQCMVMSNKIQNKSTFYPILWHLKATVLCRGQCGCCQNCDPWLFSLNTPSVCFCLGMFHSLYYES